MLVLQNPYNGKSEFGLSKQVAKDELKRLFYGNKTTFYLKKYVTKMKQTFNVLENYNVPLYGEYRVRKLLDNINLPNNNFETKINIYRYIHSASFDTASIYLPTVILQLFPETHP